MRRRQGPRCQLISIHALCEEGDGSDIGIQCVTFLFLSTPSARRATRHRGCGGHQRPYFYPRPLRGGRQLQDRRLQLGKAISIHALCEEGDPSGSVHLADHIHFYPRPLRGGRRIRLPSAYPPLHISIHALCEEGDPIRASTSRSEAISIHALCEEGDGSSA